MNIQDLMNIIKTIMLEYHLVEILIILVVVIAIHLAIRRILSRFRTRGIISRGTEETIRFTSFATLSLIVLAVAISYWFQNYITLTFFISLLAMFIGVIIYALRTYIENALSYLVFVTSNVARDGEIIKVEYGDKIYEGKINITEGGYATIVMENNAVYIPYSILLKSIIIKSLYNIVRFKLKLRGQNLDLEKVVEDIKEATKSLKMINKESIEIKPIEVKEDEIILNISFEVPNPRNIEECYETLVKILTRKMPYRISFELATR